MRMIRKALSMLLVLCMLCGAVTESGVCQENAGAEEDGPPDDDDPDGNEDPSVPAAVLAAVPAAVLAAVPAAVPDLPGPAWTLPPAPVSAGLHN